MAKKKEIEGVLRCIKCGVVIFGRSNKRFCSKKCIRSYWYKENVTDKREPKPIITITEKKCTSCGEVKPLNQYYRASYKAIEQKEACKDGHRSCCKKCWMEKNKKQVDLYKKRHPEWYKEIKRKGNKIYRERHGDIIRRVRRALKSGKLNKPELCSSCGEKKQLDGHHEDYSKPLSVIWLCRKCHLALHNRRKCA